MLFRWLGMLFRLIFCQVFVDLFELLNLLLLVLFHLLELLNNLLLLIKRWELRLAAVEYNHQNQTESANQSIDQRVPLLFGFRPVPAPSVRRMRFSRLLRQPSDPRTATVTASKRGGRTLILDIIPRRGYQPLSEVRLALWLKAGMLVPGQRVKIYGGLGGESPLLVSSAQRGGAILGTMNGRSTVQPGPVTPLDEKVSGATLVEWAAWAASTTFSSTGRRFGYDKREVDVFRSTVRDTFLGGAVFWVSTPPVKSDDFRGQQFSTDRRGYDKKQVDAFLEAAGIRLAAMESTGRPAGPLVSGALLVAWAEWADSATFDRMSGYTATAVSVISRRCQTPT